MELDELLNIDTPENVVFGYEIAGIGSRFMAALVDTILIVILEVIANIVLLLFITSDESWVIAIFGLISFAILWGYYIFFELNWSGQSPGKRWVGLRVIRVDGTPISLSESLIRNLIRLIDFLPVSYGVGVVTMFITSQSRRLGDLAAGTIVVWEQERVTLDSLAKETRAVAASSVVVTAEIQSDLPIDKLREADIQMAENFLARRYELPNRVDLAMKIQKALYNRMDIVLSPFLPATEYEKRIQEVVSAYRAREGSNL
jgi:uncharacterized RDD family membrane protein YckC